MENNEASAQLQHLVGQLRELLQKAGEHPRLEPVVGEGKYYDCPLCGEGSIEAEQVREGVVSHGTGLALNIVGVQTFGFGEGFVALEKLILLALHRLPALLDVVEAADQWGRATDYDSREAYLAELRLALCLLALEKSRP